MLSSTTLFAILSALALSSVQAAPADKDSLDYLASKAGKRYLGTAIQSYQLVNNPQYVSILESQFDAITPENEMKWEVVEPTEGNFDFSGTDKVRACYTCYGFTPTDTGSFGCATDHRRS